MGCLILHCSGGIYKNPTYKKGFDKTQDAAYPWSFLCLLKNLSHGAHRIVRKNRQI